MFVVSQSHSQLLRREIFLGMEQFKLYCISIGGDAIEAKKLLEKMKELYRAKAATGFNNLRSWSRLETEEGALHQFMAILKECYPILPDEEVARAEIRKAKTYIRRSEEDR